MAVMADLAALAHERVHLAASRRPPRTRIELLLKRAAADVSGSLETEEVLRHLVEHARPAGERRPRRWSAGCCPAASWRARPRRPPSGGPEIDPAQVAQVAQTRTAGTFDGAGRRPCTCRWCWARACSASCPWRARTGPFSEDEVEILLRLARTSVGAIVNAAHFEQERRVARALTRGFVPDSPPRWPASTRRPRCTSRRRARLAGGDVYGLWTRPGGDLALLIGDVAGKGAADRGHQRHDPLLRRGPQLGRRRARPRCWRARATMLRARLPADTFVTAFMAVLRDGRAALRQRRPPAAAADARRRRRPRRSQGARPAAGHRRRASTYEEHTLTLEPRRPALRLHRRPDRGAPPRRDARRAPGCARRWTPSAAPAARSRTLVQRRARGGPRLGRDPGGRLHRPGRTPTLSRLR